ncbi:MAG: gamma-glutamyl-gamma-aminobutyrate hydrolase family protein [Corynebacterium sp.]|nr:gamma-glutamyl-gamma-aminobutyrate hydrolase family protein [Corynebacterium sp.]
MTPPTVAVHHPSDHRPHHPAFQSLLDLLNDRIAAAVRNLGWRVEFIAGDSTDSAESAESAESADMIVLAGGEDVDPALYGAGASCAGAGRHLTTADQTHIRVVTRAVAEGVPVLGICRGMQLVNVALGGTLVQDMSSSLPTCAGAHGANHRREDGPDPGVFTRLAGGPAGIVPDGPAVCIHHQAVDRLAPGLRVVARASDGTVEAVVHETAPVTGVQWHPEHPAAASGNLTDLLLRMQRQAAVRPVRPVGVHIG